MDNSGRGLSYNLRVSPALILVVAVSVFAADPQSSQPGSAQKSGPTPPKVPGVTTHLQVLYDEAFNFYTAGDYQKAVMKWQQVIQENPDQVSARDWITKARKVIWQSTKKKQDEIAGLIREGEYQKAQVALQSLLDLDPDDPRLKTFRERLSGIVEIVPAYLKTGNAARAARTGTAAYLGFDPDYQLAYDAVRYSLEKEPGNELYQKLSEIVLAEAPQLIKDEVPPGMTLIAYKQHMALNQIYDGRYAEASKVLEEVTALEPENVVGFERLGSAYYCLGLKSQANQAWKKAQILAPEDKKLDGFMSGKKKLKCGPRR